MVLTCTTYRASSLPCGRIRLEIGADAPSSKQRLSTQDVADSLGKGVVQVDKLSRRLTHPLPIDRSNNRPSIERTALNHWLLGLTDADAIFGL